MEKNKVRDRDGGNMIHKQGGRERTKKIHREVESEGGNTIQKREGGITDERQKGIHRIGESEYDRERKRRELG